MEYKYKFSVIVPIYKAEKYLSEAIESVLNQTIGFEDNIEMILVNDGSPDNCEEICKTYAEKYPNNITYIWQENQGVAVARNTGLKRVQGKYINMLDADDKWTLDAFEKAYDYFEKHYDEIDVVSCREIIFGKRDGYHFLDYKYTEDKIVDITRDYQCPQLSCMAAFIKAEALGDTNFRIKTTVSEDIPFITEMIIKKGKYAILRSVEYLYRKSEDETSTTDTRYQKHDFYIASPRDAYGDIFKMSREKYGVVLPYFQYVVANSGKTRLVHKNERPACLKPGEWDTFLMLMHDVYDQIDEKIIMSLKNVSLSERVKNLIFKSGDNYNRDLVLKELAVSVDILNIKSGMLNIDGRSNIELLGDNFEMFIEDKRGNSYAFDNTPSPVYDVYDVEGNVVIPGSSFNVKLPITDDNEYSFIIRNKITGKRKKAKIKFGKFSRISKWKQSFFSENNKIFSARDNTICVEQQTLLKTLRMNAKLQHALKKNGKSELVEIRNAAERLRKGKPIWLIQDSVDRAGDNAEALFKGLMNTDAKEKYRIYFAVSDKSADYERMKQYGTVVRYESKEYKALFLAADKFISSQCDYTSKANPTLNPFRADRKYVQDMIKSDFIFLQHGINDNDMSVYLHKLKRNARLLTCSTTSEYADFISGKYGYSADEMMLAGLVRFDYLEDCKDKVVLIMPTFRKGLDVVSDEAFRDTEFYKFYQNLISDSELISCMKEHGYRGIFVTHPMLRATNKQQNFIGNDTITIDDNNYSYRELFGLGSLLITDYSSVVFDFGFLKKPIIYSHFDEERFYSGHTYTKGYFDHEKDGFGPILRNYEDTISEIKKYICKDCAVEEKYLKRIERFYKYTDKNNCERTYRAIEQMQ